MPSDERAAVAVVLRPAVAEARDRDLELLLIKRAEHPKDPWSGHMALPGGRVDVEDGEPLAAALRETREEVGLSLEQHEARLLGMLDDRQARSRRGLHALVVTPFVFALDRREVSLLPDPTEVDEVVWIPLSRLLDPAVRSTMDYDLGGRTLTLPCLRVDGRVIWGLTWRMLAGFFKAMGWVDLGPHP